METDARVTAHVLISLCMRRARAGPGSPCFRDQTGRGLVPSSQTKVACLETVSRPHGRTPPPAGHHGRSGGPRAAPAAGGARLSNTRHNAKKCNMHAFSPSAAAGTSFDASVFRIFISNRVRRWNSEHCH
jgi:hypothetical protein